ncbi:hypothetical protein A2824_03405 [Candidatus Nomurabacteria bacterium RIFCSPHIGHO2_01_FULL_42_16]|uniref:Uncharacterized protein n=1 Tax=Candidatus Nomurabacteria bacterium RIFCSPHIGHO2_01_FULL_42_16 TaxID=1801743 RepID=A0A1F6VIT4_9BACT|nr:MAG: hypothetical protein A2824_03405 [Candidatus Nomurabacteria bacterium RIFCSPHIGHO2_01_FULL_42_16]
MVNSKEQKPTPGAKKESVLTPKDKERLDKLFSEVGERTLFYGEEDRDEWISRLSEEGQKARDYIFEKLEKIPAQDPSDKLRDSKEFFKYTNWLEQIAQPEDSEKLGQILTRNDILNPLDRSSRGNIISALRKNGTYENLNSLKTFVENVVKSDELNEKHKWLDLDSVGGILEIIIERTEDKKEIGKLGSFWGIVKQEKKQFPRPTK